MRTETPEFEVAATALPGRVMKINRYDAVKPVVEFTLALIILVFSAPVVFAAIVLVKLSSRGPAIYTQKRLGRGGKIFTIYKLRTMYLDSERHSGPTWSVPGDPRVTPIGRILRWCHVDELPQAINILQGEMSLVGPRPERPETGTDRIGAGATAPRHESGERAAEAKLRPALHRAHEPLARPPPHHGHCAQMPGCPLRRDRLDLAVAGSGRSTWS
jgi:Bacterial sugar transferase